jgi:hypothetical protein
MRRECQRQRCAEVTASPSSPDAAEHLRSRANFSGLYEQNLDLPVISTFVPLHLRLSQLVRANEETIADACAPPTTTTDHFLCVLQHDQGQPRSADQSHAARFFARRSHAGHARCTAEGLGNRRCLPPQPHPSLSRSHEEGNVDQRIATGGMPHRDR